MAAGQATRRRGSKEQGERLPGVEYYRADSFPAYPFSELGPLELTPRSEQEGRSRDYPGRTDFMGRMGRGWSPPAPQVVPEEYRQRPEHVSYSEDQFGRDVRGKASELYGKYADITRGRYDFLQKLGEEPPDSKSWADTKLIWSKEDRDTPPWWEVTPRKTFKFLTSLLPREPWEQALDLASGPLWSVGKAGVKVAGELMGPLAKAGEALQAMLLPLGATEKFFERGEEARRATRGITPTKRGVAGGFTDPKTWSKSQREAHAAWVKAFRERDALMKKHMTPEEQAIYAKTREAREAEWRKAYPDEPPLTERELFLEQAGFTGQRSTWDPNYPRGRGGARPHYGKSLFRDSKPGDGSPLSQFKGPLGPVELGHVALESGPIGDAISTAFLSSRQLDGRMPTKREVESWAELVFADQGRELPDEIRQVLKFHEPEYLVDLTTRHVRDVDFFELARTWYEDFHKFAESVVGKNNMEEFSVIWAMRSPQNPVEMNLRDTFAVMSLTREYAMEIKKAGKAWNDDEYWNFFASVLRPEEDVKKRVIAGERIFVKGPAGTPFEVRMNSSAKIDERGVVVGVKRNSQLIPDKRIKAISKFYREGEFEGDLKTGSYLWNTLLGPRLGGGGTATNDVRIGNFYGRLPRRKIVKGQPKISAGMFGQDGYEAVQALAAETAREVTHRIGKPVTTGHVQAIWWMFGEIEMGKRSVAGKLGKNWRWPAGGLDSAVNYSMPEIDYFRKHFPSKKRFSKASAEIKWHSPKMEGKIPMNAEAFVRATKGELDDLSKLTGGKQWGNAAEKLRRRLAAAIADPDSKDSYILDLEKKAKELFNELHVEHKKKMGHWPRAPVYEPPTTGADVLGKLGAAAAKGAK